MDSKVFKRRPVEVTAIQLKSAADMPKLIDWLRENKRIHAEFSSDPACICISYKTNGWYGFSEGNSCVSIGDWIVFGDTIKVYSDKAFHVKYIAA